MAWGGKQGARTLGSDLDAWVRLLISREQLGAEAAFVFQLRLYYHLLRFPPPAPGPAPCC